MSDELEGERTEVARVAQKLGSSVSRRTLLGGAALAIGGAALAACSTSSSGGGTAAAAGSSASLLKTIQSRGTLNVTTTLQYPPEMYKDSSGNAAGYDVEIMKLIAADLKVKLNVLDVNDNAANIANVLSGKADMVMEGLVNTPARALVMNFTRGYVPYTQVVIVPKQGGASSVADLNQSGKKITALQGSTALFRAQLLFPKATITGLDQLSALLSVATGKADACLVEYYLAAPFIAQHSNVTLMQGGKPVATEFGCIGVLAGDVPWWLWLNNWIAYNTDNTQLPGMYKNIISLDWVQPS
jgi:ABC-type amino acid transport/signal transduction systems, periplasmic component/domain